MSLLIPLPSVSTPISSNRGKQRVRLICTRCKIEKDKCTFPQGSRECVKCLNAISNGETTPHPIRKKCSECDRMKSGKAFHNGSDICRHCQNVKGFPIIPEDLKLISEIRRCSGCGVSKFASRFRGPTSICLKCWSKIDKEQTLEDLIIKYHYLKLEHEELKSTQLPLQVGVVESRINESEILTTPERPSPPSEEECPTPARSPDPAFVRFIADSPATI
jgi:hypothetical protein